MSYNDFLLIFRLFLCVWIGLTMFFVFRNIDKIAILELEVKRLKEKVKSEEDNNKQNDKATK